MLVRLRRPAAPVRSRPNSLAVSCSPRTTTAIASAVQPERSDRHPGLRIRTRRRPVERARRELGRRRRRSCRRRDRPSRRSRMAAESTGHRHAAAWRSVRRHDRRQRAEVVRATRVRVVDRRHRAVGQGRVDHPSLRAHGTRDRAVRGDDVTARRGPRCRAEEPLPHTRRTAHVLHRVAVVEGPFARSRRRRGDMMKRRMSSTSAAPPVPPAASPQSGGTSPPSATAAIGNRGAALRPVVVLVEGRPRCSQSRVRRSCGSSSPVTERSRRTISVRAGPRS